MMNEWINDELLSAYLDGEVTAEEQAQIEELLAAQPQARQLLEELRALSGALQSLPPARLEADLSERVIRAAQRQILTGDKAATASTSSAGSLWTRLRKRLTGRAVFWPAVAAALALWIVLTDLGRVGDAPHQREVVRAPAPEMTAVDDSASVGPKSKTTGGDVAAGGMGSNRLPAGVRAEAAAVGKPGDAALSDGAATGAADGAMLPPKPAMFDPAGPGDEGMHRKAMEKERWDVAAAAAEPRNGAADRGKPMAYGDSGRSESSTGESSAGGSSRGEASEPDRPANRRFSALRNAEGLARASVGAVPPGTKAAAARPSADALAADDGGTLRTSEGESGRRSGIASVEPAMEATADESVTAEDGIVVVHVDIAADAARNDLFGQLLARNSILWEPDPALVGASGWNNVNPQWRSADAGNAAGAHRDSPRESAAPAEGNAGLRAENQRSEQKAAPADNGTPGATDRRLVEGGSAQPPAPRALAEPAKGNNAPAAAGAAPENIAGNQGKVRGGDGGPPATAVPEMDQLPEVRAAADSSRLAKSDRRAKSEEPLRGADSDATARRALKAPPSPEIELVYVEAQASQIQNLIADLANAHQSVVSVAVEPARGSQQFADRQRLPIASQLAQGKLVPSAVPPTVPSVAPSVVPPPGAPTVGGGAAEGPADKMPLSPEKPAANGSPTVPRERPSRASPGSDGPRAEIGPGPGPFGGVPGAAPAGEEIELLARTADRAELARRGALQQADPYRQGNPAAGEAPAGQGDASGQVLFGRAHRVARLDTQNQVVGQTLKDQIAAARRTGGETVDAEPAPPDASQSPPGAGGRQRHDDLRQAFAKREADQASKTATDTPSAPDTAVDAVEAAEKAKQRDDGFGRDLPLAQSHAQAVLPQAARQQRVLFVLRTVPSVQAAASRPPMAAPAAAATEANAAPEADAASESGRPAPQGEAHRDMLPAAPSAEPARQ